MSDVEKTRYEKPAVERYGSFRELTRLTGDWTCMYTRCDDTQQESNWS